MTLENQQSSEQTQDTPSGAETQQEVHDPLDDLVNEIEENLDDREGFTASREPDRVQDTPSSENAEELEPPQHWSEEHKRVFRSQTPEARKFLLDRHRQMEGDYTQKTQQLAQQAQAVAGLQGLGARLQQDPQFRQHMQSYFQQQAMQGKPESTQPKTEEVEDPIVAIENRAAERAYERIKQEQHVQAQQAQTHEFERAYNAAEKIKHDDPLSQQVMQKLNGYVELQKHPMRKQETLRQLDQNPFFFLEMYRVLREEVVAEQQTQEDGEEQPRRQPSRRTVAPTLERGGGAPVATSQAKARKRRSDMKNQALRLGTDEALGEFLDSTGLIDNLL